MKAVLIQGHMEQAMFKMPLWNKRGESYPLPPFSTVAGMVHHLCQWDSWHEMKISVAGNGVMNKPELCMRWRGGAIAKTETEEFKKRFPVRVKSGDSFVGWVRTPIYESYVSDLDLQLHIMPEDQNEIEVIRDHILYPRTFPNLGQYEDLIRIDNVQIVDILPPREMILQMEMYAKPVPGISGTVYSVHKNYVIDNGKRRFDDVKAVYVDQGTKMFTDCDNLNNPCIFF